MRAVQRAGAGAVGVGGAAREQLGGDGAGRGALAAPGRAVQQVGVRRAPCGGRPEHGGGVRVGFQGGEHGARSVVASEDVAGRLITVEGIDGAGKTTLATALAQALGATLLREPGGVALSERIRALVKDPALAIDARAEALLYAAARAQLVAERVAPLLAGGSDVLLDRFVDSSLAYQGGGRGLGVEAVRALNAFGTGGLAPDRTLLLRIDPAIALGRAAGRGGADRLEREGLGFFAAIAAVYDELAAAEPARFAVLDAAQPPEAVLRDALQAL
jgi:dTMP kinase